MTQERQRWLVTLSDDVTMTSHVTTVVCARTWSRTEDPGTAAFGVDIVEVELTRGVFVGGATIDGVGHAHVLAVVLALNDRAVDAYIGAVGTVWKVNQGHRRLTKLIKVLNGSHDDSRS